jgi:Patatin-like phospholipase
MPDPHFYIWEAARATCAAPTFFQPARLDSESGDPNHIVLVDGGLGHNNPTLHLLEEARAQWPGRKIESVLSIGTGRQKGDQIFVDALISTLQGRAKSLLLGSKYLKQVATSSENIHEAVKNQFAAMGYSQGLFRYSVPKEYDMNVELDDYKKYSTIKDSTAKYLRENTVKEQMARYSQIFGSNQGVHNPGHIDLPKEQQVHLSPEERSRIQCEIKEDIAAYNPKTYPIEAFEFCVGIARFSSVDDFQNDPDIFSQGFGKVVCTIPLRQGDSGDYGPRVVLQLPHSDPGNFLVLWLVKLVYKVAKLGPAENSEELGPLAELKSLETPDKESAALTTEMPEATDNPTEGIPGPVPKTVREQTAPPEAISVALEFSATEEPLRQNDSEDEENKSQTHYQRIMCLSQQWEAVGGNRAEPISLSGGGKIKFTISLEESEIPAGLALLLGGIRLVGSFYT